MPDRFPSLTLMQPPYDTSAARQLLLDSTCRTALPQGALIAIEVRSPATDGQSLTEMVPAIRARFPSASMILRADACTPELLDLWTRAARLGVRAVLCGEQDAPAALRRRLAHPIHLPTDVVEWLQFRGVPVRPMSAHLIFQIFALAPHHRDVGSLVKELHEPLSAVRNRFRRRGLPAPREWFGMARGLCAALRIQAQPETPLLRLAAQLGYHDQGSLSRQIQQVFGVRPTAVREALGWEWLVDRWASRNVEHLGAASI